MARVVSRKRAVTEDERALFEAVLRGAKTDDEPAPPKPAEEAKKPPLPKASRHRPTGIDGRTAERLRKGAIEPDTKIDLHGYTEQAAHDALAKFLRQAATGGARLALVVTGKGLKPAAPDEPFDLELDRRTRGVLKAMVPRWLQEPSLVRFVADVRTAHRRHGGAGALYVYLRKERKPH
jgi:DNA-nicking Smr family endonuclease